MSTEIAREFHTALEAAWTELRTLPASLADTPWRTGGWTRKQIVGHLLDSAANNRQRFVRASTDGRYTGPGYAQDAWVAAHGYGQQSWEKLLAWWHAENEILVEVVDRIAPVRLDAPCTVGDGAPVPLHFLVTDYLRHLNHHLAQLKTGLFAP